MSPRTALRYLLMTAVTLTFLFPIYWLFICAFKTPEEIFASPPVWWPQGLALNAWTQIWRDNDLVGIVNSLVIAGVSTAVAMVLGTMAAYSLARYRTGGEHLAMWIISQRLIPPIAIVFPVFILFAWAGLVDSYTGLILLYSAFNLPYVIWMMRGYIEDMPRELEDAALVDGCSRFQMLFRIVFPVVRSGFFATAVFTFVFAWNEFIMALVLTRTQVATYPVIMAGYFNPQFTQWGRIGALSLVASLPVFLVVGLAQRYLVRGLSLGAVKG